MKIRAHTFSKLCFMFCFLSFAVSPFVAVNFSHGITVDRVLATVGNDVITLSDYQRFIKGLGMKEDGGKVDAVLLKELIEVKVILQEAIRKGVEASDMEVNKVIEEFKKQNNLLSQEDLENMLAKEGINIPDFIRLIKDKVTGLKFIDTEVDSKIVMIDKEVEDFYNTHKKDYLNSPEKVEIKTIFLRLRKDASVTEITDLKRRVLKITALLKGGNSFEKLVEEYADEPMRSQKGRMGEFVRRALVPPLDNKAFSMKNGEISEPIWTEEGVYILQLVNKTDESFRPLDEVKGEIYKNLYNQKREKLFIDLRGRLWERASITIKQE
jgi:parvulin-like peptidyl-prolyl isomerase